MHGGRWRRAPPAGCSYAGVAGRGGGPAGVRPVRSWVSELALSDRGVVLVGACVISGVLIVALARACAAVTAGPGATWGHRLVTTAVLVAAAFAYSPRTYLPVGCVTARVTWHGILHDVAGPVMTWLVAAASVVYSRRFALARDGLATAVATVAFWVVASGAQRTRPRRCPGPWTAACSSGCP